jgi:hypothetical protein
MVTTPVFLSVTGLLELWVPMAVVLNVKVPGVAVAVGTAPVPDRDAVWTGPLWESSLMVKVPVRVPVAVGVKTTVTRQLPPAATEDPQLFDCEKSPVTEMELMFSDMVPPLLMVTVDPAELVPTLVVANVRLEGETVAADDPPVPVRRMLPVTPSELSVTVTLPKNVPVCVGRKVTLIEQELPTASEAGQLLVWAKAMAPLAVIDDMFSTELPVLDKTTVCGALVLPIRWRAKVTEPGEKEATGAIAVPVRAMS